MNFKNKNTLLVLVSVALMLLGIWGHRTAYLSGVSYSESQLFTQNSEDIVVPDAEETSFMWTPKIVAGATLSSLCLLLGFIGLWKLSRRISDPAI